MIRIHRRTLFWTGITLLLFLASIFTIASQAQDLGYEGPTGVFVTPLASVASSESNGFGHPVRRITF